MLEIICMVHFLICFYYLYFNLGKQTVDEFSCRTIDRLENEIIDAEGNAAWVNAKSGCCDVIGCWSIIGEFGVSVIAFQSPASFYIDAKWPPVYGEIMPTPAVI